MKANITSLELHFLVDELQFLIGSRVDNVYNPAKEEFILQLHTSGKGKQILRITAGKLFYLASSKESAEEPSGFCMFLRKHLGNSRLRSIKQIGSERIVEFVFEKEEEKKLIVELFGKGNIILCDKNHTVLSALVYHKWKDREIMAKGKYSYPKMEYNLFELKLNELEEIFKKSGKELVKCLATELGLGGSYSEEACLLSKTDKNSAPSGLNEEDTKRIFKAINSIINSKFNPLIVYKDGEAEDIIPFELEIYKGLEKKEFKGYNEVFDYYFLNEFKEEKPKTKYEKDIEKLKRRITEQEKIISELNSRETEERNKAELIYQNYGIVKEILEEVKKYLKEHGWDKVKGHKSVKAYNPKDKTIDIEL